jgi:hypothetical protein
MSPTALMAVTATLPVYGLRKRRRRRRILKVIHW